jgi:hypothetical protein
VLAAAVRPSEDRILAIEGDRPDGALDGVGIDLDPAVVEEADQSVLAAEAIGSASDEVAGAAVARMAPRSKAIASSNRPSTVRRVASAISVCERGFMRQIPFGFESIRRDWPFHGWAIENSVGGNGTKKIDGQ